MGGGRPNGHTTNSPFSRWEQLRDLFPEDFVDSREKRANSYGGDKVYTHLSGKFALIEVVFSFGSLLLIEKNPPPPRPPKAFLIRLKRHTRDRIVLVSNFTQTLDILDKLCSKHGW